MIEYTFGEPPPSSLRHKLTAFFQQPSAVGSAAPTGMFERFDADARRRIVESQELGFALKRPWNGTEHLLAVIARDDNPGSHLLTALGSSPAVVVAALDRENRKIGPGSTERAAHLPMTVNLKRALEQAFRCSLAVNEEHVGADHLVVGLLENRSSMAAQVLSSVNVTHKDALRLVGRN